MPLALLLSPDDQAVSAITSVLEEMSVDFERPLDGASAAEKLNSDRFDLVLVDCENLPAAKRIFDVCRNRKGGRNPVAVAVVDGRAGLPTAFRLGAELILTKPVAKDQARSTIRTAISRMKKEESARIVPNSGQVDLTLADATQPIVSADQQSPPVGNGQPSESVASAALPARTMPARTMAAAAGLGSDGANSPQREAFDARVPAPASLSEAQATMSAAVAPAAVKEPAASPVGSAATSATLKPATPQRSDAVKTVDPQTTASEPTLEAEPEEKEKATVSADSGSETVQENTAQKNSERAVTERREKTRRSPIALFALLVVCAVFYAAWTYQPGFRAVAQAQINRALAFVKNVRNPQQAAPATVKPAPQPIPVSTSPAEQAQPVQPSALVPAPTTTPVGPVPVNSVPTGSSSAVSPPAVSPPATPVPPTSTPANPGAHAGALSSAPAANVAAAASTSAHASPAKTPPSAGPAQPPR